VSAALTLSSVAHAPLHGCARSSVADALSELLVRAGVTHAFGVTGSAIAFFHRSLAATPIHVVDCRHESGAAFAATEASLATGRTSVVFTTAGPGLTNALTGMVAARWEGARVVLVSGATPVAKRGRGAIQETHISATDVLPLFRGEPLFHFMASIEHSEDLDAFESALSDAALDPRGFIAHLSFPFDIQPSDVGPRRSPAPASRELVRAREAASCAQALRADGFAIWVGFGARGAAPEVRELAERAGVPVFSSPRAKGTFPESHPQYLGVTGVGGHDKVAPALARQRPGRVLVLGSRLGEATSLWSKAFVPPNGFVHVDLDPSAFGAAYPDVPTMGIVDDVAAFVSRLVDEWPQRDSPPLLTLPRVARGSLESRSEHGVRPRYLMRAIQSQIIDATGARVMAESGNSLLWANHELSFEEPNRYRVSTGFGSMAHMATGVVGAAMARGERTVAIVGDGAMLMQSEVSTAVRNRVPAMWIVLNDSRYGIVEEGMRSLGWTPFGTKIASVDFAMVARAMGCASSRVTQEAELAGAISAGLATNGPVVIDVVVTDDPAPLASRNASLQRQLWSAGS
jgi:acetolactate synthase-1/2/3 large subunit